MKKTIAFLLTLLMVLSLTACGDQPDNKGSNITSEQTSTTTSTPNQDKGPVSSQAAASSASSTVSDSDSSDSGSGADDSVKTILDSVAKPANGTLSESGADFVTYTVSDTTYQDVIDYEKILKDCGYSIHLPSTYGNYEAEADHVHAEIKIVFRYTGEDYISNPNDFAKRAEQGKPDPGDITVTIRARALGSYNLPPLPEGDWRIDDNDFFVNHKLNSYENCSKEGRRTLAKNYVELLKTSGYTIGVSEYPDGRDGNYVSGYESLYEFYASDKIGNQVTVKVATREVFDPYNQSGTDDWAEMEISLKKVPQN